MKLLLLLVAASAVKMSTSENPIRKIVNLLQSTQKKVEEEGAKMDSAFEKFVCYCETNTKSLAQSVDALTEEVPQHESSVKSKSEQKAQVEEELKTHKADRESSTGSIETATKQRNKDKDAFDAYKTEAMSNIASMTKAVTALRAGMGDSFLQSSAAELSRAAASQLDNMSSFDAETLSAFLQGKMQSSGEIVGILEQMGENMAADLKDAEESEATGLQEFDGLVAAKNKEIAAATTAIEDKTARVGNLAVDIVNAKQDLKDTQSALAADTQFLLELKETCSTQVSMYDTVKKTRAEEIEAIGATVKILNDDDALELFKKTLPGASFLQVRSSLSVAASMRRAAAADVVAQIPRSVPRHALDLVELALRGQKVGFDKILGMIDNLIGELKKEQVDDDEKSEYCAEEFDKSDDKKKATEREISDTQKAIAKANEDIASLSDEMSELEAGIVALDADVTEATEQRKDEHEDYEELMASDATAQEVLEFAKNRLNKFYNPKLYKAPPKRELSEEDRITVNMGGTLAPTAAPGGIAGTGVGAALLQAGAAYTKKTEESGGVIAMIDLLIADLEKEMTEAKMEETHAQEDYEDLLAESAEKRGKDSKSYAQKEAAHAEATSSLEDFKGDLAAGEKGLTATLSYIQSLHADCDFLTKYYDMRKEMRGKEIDGLVNAKAALHGASFVEESPRSTRFLGQQ